MATQFENESTAAISTLEKCREITGCPSGVDLQDWVKRLAAERDEALNAERIWEKTMVEVCGEDGPASVASEIRSLQALRDTAMQALKSQVGQLAAENVGLKKFIQTDCFVGHIEPETFHEEEVTRYVSADGYEPETPATDAYLTGIKADGRVEGINFAASRLAAAFNHGFVDKPMAEVFDVVRMILTAKEDLANDPVLAADGLSGEYAEKALAEWEIELREGAK
ncbi:ead/Ea22-like family protein [Raoultella ornithinolytica]|uniref:ead/Ea22-like family protein n=1 Tax=Raoultella ornithinolytica TaxID=54291 RepID=UPI001CCB9E54|nr:ead/Ea22-like family protein [Raoultella ornithinolytica]